MEGFKLKDDINDVVHSSGYMENGFREARGKDEIRQEATAGLGLGGWWILKGWWC